LWYAQGSETNSGRCRLTLQLNVTAREALTVYLDTLPADVEYLFSSEKTGKRLTEQPCGIWSKNTCEWPNWRDSAPHLRHRFGYVMAEKTPLHRLAQIMGHDSLDTTMIYIKNPRRSSGWGGKDCMAVMTLELVANILW
jgi:integrase